MCTVTFIPSRDKIFITSNRDEKYSRMPARLPAYYRHNGTTLVYPADAEKDGTWIALNENGNVAVLLNGAFTKHKPQPFYRKSRGLIIPEILSQEHPSFYFNRLFLDDIEPFTLVLLESNSLYEMRWDGTQKYCVQLPSGRPHIWSSITLYDAISARKREQWFAAFLNKCPVPTQQDILNFHQSAGEGDPHTNLHMSKDGIYNTVSTTGVLICEGRGSMTYFDHLNIKKIEKKIELTGASLAV